MSTLLQQFQTNPFYSYFAGALQSLADTAMASIVGGFIVRDKIAVLEREQTIGAAPAFLKFAQLVEELRAQLNEHIAKQSNEQS